MTNKSDIKKLVGQIAVRKIGYIFRFANQSNLIINEKIMTISKFICLI